MDGWYRALLSFSYYLHEKAEESRHNESMCFMIALLGSVFMVAGIIQTLLTATRPEWFLIFPYHIGSSPYDFMGLAFSLLGITLFLGGVVLAVHYGAQRLWYSNALKEGYKMEEEKMRAQKGHENRIPLPELAREMNPLSNLLEPKAENQEAS
jgi:hypothetical protein